MKTAQKAPIPTPAGKRPSKGPASTHSRPRRFSLIYSSDDSSLSDTNEVTANDAELIRQLRTSGLTYAAIEDSSDTDDDDDDDDGFSEDDSDSDYTSSSSDDETVDFVRLSAQRKKRAMEVLNAIQRGEQPPVLLNGSVNKRRGKRNSETGTDSNDSDSNFGSNASGNSNSDTGELVVSSGRRGNTRAGIGIRSHTTISNKVKERKVLEEEGDKEADEEDLGEEVPDTQTTLDSKGIDEVDRMYVPNLGESEDEEKGKLSNNDGDSDYDIDQDAYFSVIKEDMDETGEISDDAPILEEEEQNIVSELHNDDDNLSFDDGSIHESGSDPAEGESSDYYDNNDEDDGDEGIDADNVDDHIDNDAVGGIVGNNDSDDSDEDDLMMSDFDVAFYEDPKLSKLYYYQDSIEPKVSISGDLPIILTDEKKRLLQQKLTRRKERKERLQARRLLRKKTGMNSYGYGYGGSSIRNGYSTINSKRPGTRNLGIDINHLTGIITGNDSNNNRCSNNGSDGNGMRRLAFDDNEYSFREFFYDDNFQRNLDDYTPLSDVTSDSEYENILLNVSYKRPSNDTGKMGHLKNGGVKQDSVGDLEYLEEDIDSDNEESNISSEDDSSMSNIFIDIDDLDPDSLYFQYSDDDTSSFYDSSDDSKLSKDNDSPGDIETVTYVDNDETDDDDNIPPPDQRDQSIGVCAREVIDSNATDLRPPKLGTWQTNNKPFSIIDGLSTKSLYALIQEHQQLHEQREKALNSAASTSGGNNNNSNGFDTTGIPSNNDKGVDEISLNELLNMSDLEDDPHNSQSYQRIWNTEPVAPVSTFSNENIDTFQDFDDYLVPGSDIRKVSVGYLGNDHARRKIDKMKEMQRKRTEKKRQLKKRRKLLKLRRERARAEKVGSLMPPLDTPLEEPLAPPQELVNDIPPREEHEPDMAADMKTSEGRRSRKSSIKNIGLEEINKLLLEENKDIFNNEIAIVFGDDDGEGFNDAMFEDNNDSFINKTDSNILASLTAPLDFDDFLKSNTSHWKQRRQSLVEATAENLRYTKNGLFSEAAMADIESILNGSNMSSGYDPNDILQ